MELSKENLFRWRVEQGLTTQEIQKITGHSHKFVKKHLEKFGLNRSKVELKMVYYFSKMKIGDSISQTELMKIVGYTNSTRFKQFEENIIKEIHSLGIYRDTKNNYVKVS